MTGKLHWLAGARQRRAVNMTATTPLLHWSWLLIFRLTTLVIFWTNPSLGERQEQGEPVVVNTTNGALSGVRLSNGQYFLGIPYATPPLGDLRWRPTQPMTNWTGYHSTYFCFPFSSSHRRLVLFRDVDLVEAWSRSVAVVGIGFSFRLML